MYILCLEIKTLEKYFLSFQFITPFAMCSINLNSRQAHHTGTESEFLIRNDQNMNERLSLIFFIWINLIFKPEN
jgi:hypothetical protein